MTIQAHVRECVSKSVGNMLGGLILAGGQGKRIQKNKALLMLGGRPLLLHVVDNIRSIVEEIVVVVGFQDNPKDYEAFLPPEVNTLKDMVFGKGPLMGILSGMRGLKSKYALISTCDSPFSKKELIDYLISKARRVDAVIPVWPNGNSEPLHAIYRVSSAIPAAENAVNNDELLVLDMVKRLDKTIYVGTERLREFDRDLLTFFNINDAEDMMVAEKLYREQTLRS